MNLLHKILSFIFPWLSHKDSDNLHHLEIHSTPSYPPMTPPPIPTPQQHTGDSSTFKNAIDGGQLDDYLKKKNATHNK